MISKCANKNPIGIVCITPLCTVKCNKILKITKCNNIEDKNHINNILLTDKLCNNVNMAKRGINIDNILDVICIGFEFSRSMSGRTPPIMPKNNNASD